MRNRPWILAAAALFLLPLAAQANDPQYSFVQTGWVSVDPDAGDSGDGFAFDASFGLTDFVHIVGAHQDVDFDVASTSISRSMLQIGAGVHHSIRDGMDLFGEASWVEADVDALGVSASEDGYSLGAGVRTMITDAFEVNGGVNYLDLGPDDETAFGVNALYNFTQRFAVRAGYELGDDANTFQVGVRYNFGR